MHMIRTAALSDTPRLKEIWQICFGDPERYIDFFFQNAFHPEQTLVWEEDGTVCAMFFLLDCSVWAGGSEVPAAYLYAAATMPAYRSRGIMGRMIRYAAGFVSSCGYGGIVLVPAEPGLFDYYGRFGFRTCFYDAVEDIVPERDPIDSAGLGIAPTDFSTLERLRRAVVQENGGVMWNGVQFDYALREHLFTGGRIFQTQDGYAMYHCTADVCTVDELIALPGRMGIFHRALFEEVPAARFRIVHPCGKEWGARPRGMFWDLNHKLSGACAPEGCPYIGLTLG